MRLFLLLFAFICAGSLARAQPDVAPAQITGHLQIARYGAAAVEVAGQIWVVGGAARSETTASVERIDPATGASTLLRPNISPRFFGSAESSGPFIFIFGGQDETGQLTTRVERLDTRTLQVARMAPLPVGRRTPSSAIVGEVIYLAGGAELGGDRSDELWIYSIADDEWNAGAPMLLAKETDLVAREQTLYAVAGFNGEAATDDFEAYDIVTNAWRALPPLPFKMSAHHGAVVGDDLWTFGDYAQRGRVSHYNFETAQWQLVENTGYTPRRHAAVVAVGSDIWIFGGNTESSNSSAKDTLERFDSTREKVVAVP